VPSFYALDLLRATEGHLPELRQLEEQAAAGSQSILGWPAPQRAETAIDDAEFDLAVVEPLLHHSEEQARSRARYLLLTNERLARSLRVRFQRWRAKLSAADGLVRPSPAALRNLSPHRLQQRSYSPTALQHFAACPYRFLLSTIHTLRPRDEPSWLERLDPRTRGSLFHEVQFQLFRTLQEHRLLPVRSDDLHVVLEFADRTLEQVAARYQEELAPAIPRVWHSEIESLRADLRGWLRAVATAEEPWCPTHFEFAFGLPSKQHQDDPGEHRHEAVVLNGKRLRGAIDLVEVNDHSKHLRVTDHKTGPAPKEKQIVIGKGEILQPLLYALAAEVHLAQPVDSGRLFYCTRRGGYETREVPLNDENRQAISRVLEVIDQALETGFLPALPRENACRGCDYRTICGPLEEFRSLRKWTANAEALRGLTALRSSP
jgi:CRISPR/Cas system-associated exonuclease Cas4 (RecB family)